MVKQQALRMKRGPNIASGQEGYRLPARESVLREHGLMLRQMKKHEETEGKLSLRACWGTITILSFSPKGTPICCSSSGLLRGALVSSWEHTYGKRFRVSSVRSRPPKVGVRLYAPNHVISSTLESALRAEKFVLDFFADSLHQLSGEWIPGGYLSISVPAKPIEMGVFQYPSTGGFLGGFRFFTPKRRI